jgi:2,4-dienoyl-CoA reductase-like NADH-dependent reductase (Old Yellow Enzyme family)
MRFPLIVAQTVREVWPPKWPVFIRISATDWVEGGWDLDQSVEFSLLLKDIGIDLIDCSSGCLVMLPESAIPAGPGYQTPFATAIRQKTDIATATVGLITAPAQAEQIVASGLADAVILARELLRNPYWPLMAAQALKEKIPWPVQYERARRRG